MFFYLSNLIVSKCQRSHINSYFYLHQDHLNLYSDLLLQVYFRSCFCSVFNILSDKINIFFGLLLTASLYVGLIFCLNIGLFCCPVLLLAEGETVFCDLSWFHFYLDVNLYQCSFYRFLSVYSFSSSQIQDCPISNQAMSIHHWS